MNDTQYYEVNLHWDVATKGSISTSVPLQKTDLATGTGHAKSSREKWIPAHLFVAAVSSCLMSTFLLIADNAKLKFISFESNATGTIEKVEGKWTVTGIILKPVLIIPTAQNEAKAKKILAMSEKTCAMAKTVTTKITLQPVIIIQ